MIASAVLHPVRRWLIESVLIGVIYYAVAWMVVFAHLGVVGNTHLLWLPAGVALTAVLMRGPKMLPSILVATFLFNSAAFFGDVQSPLQATAATLITSLGSAAQAWLTAWLLRKQMRTLQIHSIVEALHFIAYAALGCMTAASIGALTLMYQDRIDADSLALTWLTWWVGDLSGMLVVAPVVLVYRSWRRGRHDWSQLSLPIIGIGFSFTLVTAFMVKHLDNSARKSEFLSSGYAVGQSVQRYIDLSMRDLASLQALFYNNDVTRGEFHHFGTALLINNRLIKAVAWVPRIKREDRLTFEARTRDSGIKDFAIRDFPESGASLPVGARAEYFPVMMVEPEWSFPGVEGVDLLTHPARRETLTASRLAGEPRASPPVALLQDEPGDGPSVVVYWPVYRNEFREEPELRDDKDLRGFVSMSFRIRRLAEESLFAFENRNAETWLIDVTEPNQERLLYHHVDGEDTPEQDGLPDLALLRQALHHETTFSFAGRHWLLFSRPSDFHAELRANGQFFGILLAGGSFTFLLAIFMIGRQRNEEAMQARDERLMSQNAVLTQLARYGSSSMVQTSEQLQELVATSAVTLKIERVSIWLLEEEDTRLTCKWLFTRSSSEFTRGSSLKVVDYPRYFDTLFKGRGFGADNAQTDLRTSEFADSYLKLLNITSMLDVPIRIGGRLAGVVCHEHVGEARQWAPDELSFASSIGDLASLVLEGSLRANAEAALQESHQALETKVAERTDELRRANERLRQLDQLKSMFIASMSHELRTPLNSIIGFTGVVLQGISGTLTDRQRDQLNRVYGSARHLLALITDVIDISKIEAGYVEVFPEAFSLNSLIDEAVATVHNQCQEKGLSLEVEISRTIPVHTDRKRLLQCVLNVLSNAVKYSEQGGINIHIGDQIDRLVIDVMDTGIGIDDEGLTKLFQPFERIDTHLRIKTPGTGLGLYLTRKIITDILQGGISVTSRPGEGSTFSIWIPHTLEIRKQTA